MIKKIAVRQLKPGMFIHDLNCAWNVHPLTPMRFKLKSDAELEKIVKLGVREVYIDSDLGTDSHDGLSTEEVQSGIEQELQEIARAMGHGAENASPFQDEIEVAFGIRGRAKDVVSKLLTDVRLGRKFEVDGVTESIEEITNSVLRNPDSLIMLSHVRGKDDYTFLHSIGVCTLMTTFCNTLCLSREVTRQASIGAILHDIGKMRVPSEILNKPGQLTDLEFDEMKQHVAYGKEYITKYNHISDISSAVLEQHHERYDGTGYPLGLKGDEISPYGQMAAIVDVYDAITSERVYHKPMPASEALRKLQEWSKFHFNAELVGHFIRGIGIYPFGTLVMLESKQLAIVIDQNRGDLLRPVVRVIYDTRRKREMTPRVLDLSVSSGRSDRIENHVPPEKWGIDMSAYLQQELRLPTTGERP